MEQMYQAGYLKQLRMFMRKTTQVSHYHLVFMGLKILLDFRQHINMK